MEEKRMESGLALSRKVTRNEPLNWGATELTKFLANAEEQALATCAIRPKWVQVLANIDRNLTGNAEALFHEVKKDHHIAAQLFSRSFATFRAACRLALSGQTYEATVLMRSVLESAVYAFASAFDPDRRKAWERRGDDEDGRKVCRAAFAWGGLMRLVRSVMNDPFVDELEKAYEQTIDFGAHPNIEGVMLNTEVTDLGDGRMRISTIHQQGGRAITVAMLEIAHAMGLVYGLLEMTFRERLRILGIDQKIAEQQRYFQGVLEELKNERDNEKREASSKPDPGPKG